MIPPHPDAGRDIGCYLADPGNDDASHATPYTLGTTVFGCISTYDDKDYYDFTTPPNKPGYLVVSVAGVQDRDYTADVDILVYTGTLTHQTYDIDTAFNPSWSGWIGVAPTTHVWLSVDSSSSIVPYALTATYTQVDDPPSSEATATVLMPGKPVTAYSFAGYSYSALTGSAFWDWYLITLQPGPATVTISNVPADLPLEVYVFDMDPQAPIRGYGSSNGATLEFTTDALPGGTYEVRVGPGVWPDVYGPGTTPASYTTKPYTLVVTQ